MKSRLQFGSVIIEIIDRVDNEDILITISKARWDDDAVQVAIPRSGAKAIGALLIGDE